MGLPPNLWLVLIWTVKIIASALTGKSYILMPTYDFGGSVADPEMKGGKGLYFERPWADSQEVPLLT